MELHIHKDYADLSAAAANMIIDCVQENPQALLCMATGDTPRLTYQLLAKRVLAENIDVSRCFFIALDEWLGVSPDNKGSCHWFLQEFLLRPMHIAPAQVHLFDAFAKDEQAACESMNQLIAAKGGIDLALVGVGMNGHIGFNEPGTSVESLTHVAVLDDTTQTVGQKYFSEKMEIKKGITVGLQQVMAAQKLLMMANGKKKAPVVSRLLTGDISNQFPASLVRLLPQAVLMVDEEAAL